MDEEGAGGGQKQVAGGCCLDGAAAKGKDQIVACGEAGDGCVLAFAEDGFAVAGKISAMGMPASASITSSTSTKRQPRCAANSGPMVVLPEP